MYKLYISFYFLAVCVISFNSCETPADPNPVGDTFAGTIVYVDSNFIPGGYYAVSIYKAKINPFDTLPVKTDSLKITFGQMEDGKYSAYYRMSNVPDGRYYIASEWIPLNDTSANRHFVLGTDGCDTVSNCTDHDDISFPNYEGVFRNFYSRLDTTIIFR